MGLARSAAVFLLYLDGTDAEILVSSAVRRRLRHHKASAPDSQIKPAVRDRGAPGSRSQEQASRSSGPRKVAVGVGLDGVAVGVGLMGAVGVAQACSLSRHTSLLLHGEPADTHWRSSSLQFSTPSQKIPLSQLRLCPPPQKPPVQTSSTTQNGPVEHGVPSGRWLGHSPVRGSHVPGSWQPPPVVEQSLGVPTHTLSMQRSSIVHRLASEQGVPSGRGFGHNPVAGLHAPTSWQPSVVEQSFGVPTQTLCSQRSPIVQRLASEHGVPSGRGFGQSPVRGSHWPGSWQPSAWEQSTVVPRQRLARHWSLRVHKWPSSHGVPSGRGLGQRPVAGSHSPGS